MIVTCKQCATPFEAFKRRTFCSNECRRARDRQALRDIRASGRETLSNRRVVVNGAVVIVQSGRTRIQSKQRMAAVGMTDTFEYLRAITCTGCGVTTIHNPHALPEYRSASGGWTEIDTERRAAVCPKCAGGNHE